MTLRYPLLAIVVLSIAPQILGSVVNISYNSMRIVSTFTPRQRVVFGELCLLYNAILYPICIALFYSKVRPILAFLRKPEADRSGDAAELQNLRERALRLPFWMVAATTLGWMPGSLFFPLSIHALAGPLPTAVFGHFFLSFTLSWLIALAYSFLYIQLIVVRAIYPQLCVGTAGIRHTARRELRPVASAMRIIHFTAGFVPLLGAALVVYVGPEHLDAASYATYRMLVSLLIATGMVGLLCAIRATNLLAQTVHAITGGET
jgi:hypothetical protein